MAKATVHYSEAFKLNVVDELSNGRFGSVNEACRAYGIRGHVTVYRWVRQYGRQDLLPKVVRVQKPGEPGEISRLKARVRQLETALADAHMDGALDRAFLEILCERTDTDLGAFKKKHGATALGGRGKRCRDGGE